MLTLVHEDVYVYVDKVEEVIQKSNITSSFQFTNNSILSVIDPGILEIKCLSGKYSSFAVTTNGTTLTFQKALSANDIVILDFRNRYFALNKRPFFGDKFLDFKDNTQQTIKVSLSGQGEAEVKYTRNQVIENQNDLYFCEGIDITESMESLSKVNIRGKTINRKTAKKNYQWSINGLWNDKEISKFESGTGLFRLRILDEEGTPLETLAGCLVANYQRGSSDSSDYAYSLNGSAEKIY